MEGYSTRLALDDHDETIGYEFVRLGKMMEDIRHGVPAEEALRKNTATYGRFDQAARIIDPRAVSYTHLDVYKRQSLDTVTAEEPHEIIFQRQIETGFTRVTLTAGTTAQLVINTTGLMPFCTNDEQTACLLYTS